jgi:hypothetical protein
VAVSKKYQLNKTDLHKILVGAGVAVAGALLTYIAELVPSVDFGEFTPVVVAIVSILVNAGRKYLGGK